MQQANKIPRDAILRKMKQEISKGIPIIISGAGVGIVGRVIEKSGADMAVVYNSGYFRFIHHCI